MIDKIPEVSPIKTKRTIRPKIVFTLRTSDATEKEIGNNKSEMTERSLPVITDLVPRNTPSAVNRN